MSVDVLPWDQRVWGVSLADPNYRDSVLQRIKARIVVTESGCAADAAHRRWCSRAEHRKAS